MSTNITKFDSFNFLSSSYLCNDLELKCVVKALTPFSGVDRKTSARYRAAFIMVEMELNELFFFDDG